MAEEALNRFNAFLGIVPGLLEELDTIVPDSKQRQREELCRQQPVQRSMKPSRSPSPQSKRSRNCSYAKQNSWRRSNGSSLQHDHRAGGEQSERHVVQDQLPHLTETDALRLHQRKRKTMSACSARHSGGPVKYRSRHMVVVYYDAEVQKRFEQIVANIARCRGLMRMCKTSMRFDMLSRCSSSSGEESDTPRILPRDRDMPAFDDVDALLEEAQALCERAAHQILRDGDCAVEVNKAKKSIEKANRLGDIVVPTLQKRAEKAEEQRRDEVWTSEKEEHNEKGDVLIETINPHGRFGSPQSIILEVDDELEVDEADDHGGSPEGIVLEVDDELEADDTDDGEDGDNPYISEVLGKFQPRNPARYAHLRRSLIERQGMAEQDQTTATPPPQGPVESSSPASTQADSGVVETGSNELQPAQKERTKGILRGLDPGNILQSRTVVLDDHDDDGDTPLPEYPAEQRSRPVRDARASDTRSKYDLKYHPIDEQIRPKYAAKRRSAHRSSFSSTVVPEQDDANIDDSDTESLPSSARNSSSGGSFQYTAQPPSSEEPPTEREPDPKATRRSGRQTNTDPQVYNLKRHPQDYAIPGFGRKAKHPAFASTQQAAQRSQKRPHESPAEADEEESVHNPRKKPRTTSSGRSPSGVKHTRKDKPAGEKRSEESVEPSTDVDDPVEDTPDNITPDDRAVDEARAAFDRIQSGDESNDEDSDPLSDLAALCRTASQPDDHPAGASQPDDPAAQAEKPLRTSSRTMVPDSDEPTSGNEPVSAFEEQYRITERRSFGPDIGEGHSEETTHSKSQISGDSDGISMPSNKSWSPTPPTTGDAPRSSAFTPVNGNQTTKLPQMYDGSADDEQENRPPKAWHTEHEPDVLLQSMRSRVASQSL